MTASTREELELALNENKRLKESLRLKENECQDLKEGFEYKSAKADDFEQECKQKAAKVKQLRDMIKAKSTDEITEKLMQKSFQNADFSLELDKLRHQLTQKTSDMAKLEAEHDEQQKVLTKMSERQGQILLQLDELKSKRDRMKKELHTDKRMLLELSDVVRTLQFVTVSYDKDEEVGDASSPSIDRPQESSVKNIKRKIEAIEHDRQLLIKECEFLREENIAKETKIMSLESQFQVLNGSQKVDGDMHDLKPANDILKNLKSYLGGDSKKCPAEESKERPSENQSNQVQPESERANQKDSSAKSPPNTTNDESKSDFETTSGGGVMIDLSASETVPCTWDAQSCASPDLCDLSSFSSIDPPTVPMDQYDKLKQEHAGALSKIMNVEEELEEAKKTFELSKIMDGQYENLKLKYEVALVKITSKESELLEANENAKMAKEEHQSLRLQHDVASSKTNPWEEKIQEANEKVEEAQEQNQDLRQEYDRVVEHQTTLEQKLREANEKAESANLEYENFKLEYDVAVEIHTNLEEEMREVNEKAEREAICQFIQLKGEHAVALRKMASLEAALLRLKQFGDFDQGDQVQQDFDSVFEKITSLENTLLEADQDAECTESGGRDGQRCNVVVGLEKAIRDANSDVENLEKQEGALEAELTTSQEESARRASLAALKRALHQDEDASQENELQPEIWFDYFVHQRKLKHALEEAAVKYNFMKAQPAERELQDRLLHHQKLKQVLKILPTEHEITSGSIGALVVYKGPSSEEGTAIKDVREKISKLQCELNKAREEAEAARENKESREGDLRLVIVQYKVLLSAYEKVVTKTDGSSQAKDNETVAELKQNLHVATAKKTLLQLELDMRDANKAKNKQKSLEKDLRDVIALYKKLAQEHKASIAKIKVLELGRPTGASSTNHGKGVQEVSNTFGIAYSQSNLSDAPSLAGTQNSDSSEIQFEDAADHYVLLKYEHDTSLARIASIEKDLKEAKKVAEAAKSKQSSREGDLRDVIHQYKILQNEYDAMVSKVKDLKEELSWVQKEVKAPKNRDVAGEIEGLTIVLENSGRMNSAEMFRQNRNIMLAQKVRLMQENNPIKDVHAREPPKKGSRGGWWNRTTSLPLR
jgi:hypothetical protein